MKTKRLLYCLLPACLTVVLYSCNDFEDTRLDVPDSERTHVGITGASTSAIEREISFINSSTVNFTVSVPERKGRVKVFLETAVNLVNEYNAANGTDYLAIPDGMYTLGDGTDNQYLIIPDTLNVSPDELTLSITPVSNVDFNRKYMLPIRISSIAANSFVGINETEDVYYLVVWTSETGGERVLWTTSASTVFNNSAQYAASLILDGNKSTYWHSALNGLPQWVAIDTRIQRTFTGFNFTSRQDAGQDAIPRSILVEVSSDNDTWIEAGTYELPDQRTGDRSKLTYTFAEPVEGRFVRLTVNTNWNGATYTYIAELDPIFE